MALLFGWPAAPALAGTVGEALQLDRFGLGATLELRNFSSFHSVAGENAIRDEARLDIDWQRRLTDYLKASMKLRAQVDDAGYVDDVVIEVPDNRRDRSNLDIAQCELAAKIGSSSRLYVGRRLYSWGSGDVYNPTDRLNSHDWLDPVEGHRADEKMASWSAAFTTTLREVQLEAVWVPFFSPSRLPTLDSRWVGLDRKTFDREFPELAGDYDDVVRLAHAPTPSPGLENSQFGVRAKTTMHGVDAALSYYDGYFDLPELDAARFEPFFPRIHVPGLSLSTSRGSFELHSETAFVLGSGRSSGSRVESVNGVDWFIEPIPALHVERALLVVEYLHVDSIDAGSPSTIPFVQRADPLLQENGLASRLQIVFDEDTSIELDFLMASFDNPSYYFGPRAIRRLRDNVKLEAGFDTFFGDRTTSLGTWSDNSRFYTTLTWAL